MTIVVMNAWQIFFKGGPMMWPILFLSIIAMAIGLNRLVRLFKAEKNLPQEKEQILSSLRQGQLKQTLRLAEQKQGLVSKIAKPAILKFGASRDLILGSMDEVLQYEADGLKAHMDILALIVNLAPLIGVLGTINAMTIVFHAVQVRSNVLNPLTAGELAAGIWQALLTTAAGLAVGILAFALYSFCALRINTITAYIQRTRLEIANILQQLSELQAAGQEMEP